MYVVGLIAVYIVGWMFGFAYGHNWTVNRLKQELLKRRGDRTSVKDLYPDKYDQNN